MTANTMPMAAARPVPMLDDANRFKLAVFGLNVSGGLSASAAAGSLRGGDWGEVNWLPGRAGSRRCKT